MQCKSHVGCALRWLCKCRRNHRPTCATFSHSNAMARHNGSRKHDGLLQIHQNRDTRNASLGEHRTESCEHSERAGKHDLLKHKANQRHWNIFDGWKKFATQFIVDIVNGGTHLYRKQQLPSPPVPKHSMLKWSVMSRRCECLSLRAASLHSLSGTPTLNSGGTGVTQRARCTSNAHMRALRTFVRQQSSHTGLASIAVVTAVCILDVVMGTHAFGKQAKATRAPWLYRWVAVSTHTPEDQYASSVNTTKHYKSWLIN